VAREEHRVGDCMIGHPRGDKLGDALLADSARRCLAIAAGRVPAELSSAVDDLAELVESGRCPGDLLAARIEKIGPLGALAELAHA